MSFFPFHSWGKKSAKNGKVVKMIYGKQRAKGNNTYPSIKRWGEREGKKMENGSIIYVYACFWIRKPWFVAWKHGGRRVMWGAHQPMRSLHQTTMRPSENDISIYSLILCHFFWLKFHVHSFHQIIISVEPSIYSVLLSLSSFPIVITFVSNC